MNAQSLLFDRRRFLQLSGTSLLSAGFLAASNLTYGSTAEKKSVAGIVTVYHKNSHADVLIGKILDGWKQDGGVGPALRLAALYVEQFPADELSRALSEKHGFPICRTIDETLTLGGKQVAVDGVISIGEHGDYPWNEKEQHLYPRRRFFKEITDVFERCQQVVPVFNDKHLGPVWEDARWMYDRARELKISFMAGSSLPVSFRKPDVELEMHSKAEAALGIGYSGLDVYGFHTLEFLQCFLERRKGAEHGVKWVQSLPGTDLKKLIAEKVIRKDLLDAALLVTPTASDRGVLEVDPTEFTIFLIQYTDDLLVPVLMLDGYAVGISAAVKVPGAEPIAAYAEERDEPFPHFANLLKGIERMIHTGKPVYPVERTLLTAGILDRLLTSRVKEGKRLETPELAIEYEPVEYPHAPHIDLEKPPA